MQSSRQGFPNFSEACRWVSSMSRNARIEHPGLLVLWWFQELFQRLGLQADVLLASGFLLEILLDPGFPALAGGSVATGKSKRCHVAIGNGNFLVGIFRKDSYYRGCKISATAAIE